MITVKLTRAEAEALVDHEDGWANREILDAAQAGTDKIYDTLKDAFPDYESTSERWVNADEAEKHRWDSVRAQLEKDLAQRMDDD